MTKTTSRKASGNKEEKKRVWYVQCANKKLLFIENIKFWGTNKFFSRESLPVALPAGTIMQAKRAFVPLHGSVFARVRSYLSF